MKVLILGVNGFIGNSLVQAILERTDWQVAGIDLATDKLGHSIENPRFRFVEGDITINREWVEYQIRAADVILPLVAIATPADYVRDPLRVFEITFEENLRIVRLCAKHGSRVVFPSTSEVYGMCEDEAFDESRSRFVLGPIDRQRWIYSCSKQLLDRVIWAHGQQGDFDFTLFRPFNWIGPKLDEVGVAREGSSRVVTQFLTKLLDGEPIQLVDGGAQRRCFTYIDDGIECLLRILANEGGKASGQIFNIGNPENDCSMRELASTLQEMFEQRTGKTRPEPGTVDVSSQSFYGDGYQDILRRKPDVSRAFERLGWQPRICLRDSLGRTLDAVLESQSVLAG